VGPKRKRKLGPPKKPATFSLVKANFMPKAFAVWTRTASSQPWQFHSAFKSRSDASEASQGLSYRYDTRITKEGYGK
jgi:hypothetical protein